MLKGKYSWVFENRPAIAATGIVGGPFEANGPLKDDFDILHTDLWMGQDSYEKAHRVVMEEAIDSALGKLNMTPDKIQFMIAGDLINQMTPTSFAARTEQIPYLGVFGACSTSMEGLALASFIINNHGADYIVTGASSHNAAVEKQFRYPTEYGAQKPPTAQWTITGAGAAIVTHRKNVQGPAPVMTSATIGKVIDMGLSDPFNMGGAMAPAAADTIITHLNDMQVDPSYYDLIVTGDLGKIGSSVLKDLLKNQHGLDIQDDLLFDCGVEIYHADQPVQAGGSGAGCSATVMYGHLLKQMKEGTYKRILWVATGALLSPLSYQQKESIPCIAHAVSVEYDQTS